MNCVQYMCTSYYIYHTKYLLVPSAQIESPLNSGYLLVADKVPVTSRVSFIQSICHIKCWNNDVFYEARLCMLIV